MSCGPLTNQAQSIPLFLHYTPDLQTMEMQSVGYHDMQIHKGCYVPHGRQKLAHLYGQGDHFVVTILRL